MTPMLDAPADLWRVSATELADAIRSKQLSSREVIEAHLRRIEAAGRGPASFPPAHAGQIEPHPLLGRVT